MDFGLGSDAFVRLGLSRCTDVTVWGEVELDLFDTCRICPRCKRETSGADVRVDRARCVKGKTKTKQKTTKIENDMSVGLG